MNIIDCQSIRDKMLEEAKVELDKIWENDGVHLKLVVVQVEGDSASDVYIRNKIKTCEQVGIECVHIKLSNDVSFDDLSKVIKGANDDNSVTGLMLQLPVPDHLKPYEQQLIDLISWGKDIDALTTENIGRLWDDKPCITPATPTGIMRLLPNDLSGQNVVIAGRSKLVGKPLIKLLQDRNATVTTIHSKSEFYVHILQGADIFISAIGRPKHWDRDYFYDELLNGTFCVKYIDVGMNRDENGKLCGDIDIETFENFDCDITPVPKGVGVLTTAQLMLNVVKAYKLQKESKL